MSSSSRRRSRSRSRSRDRERDKDRERDRERDRKRKDYDDREYDKEPQSHPTSTIDNVHYSNVNNKDSGFGPGQVSDNLGDLYAIMLLKGESITPLRENDYFDPHRINQPWNAFIPNQHKINNNNDASSSSGPGPWPHNGLIANPLTSTSVSSHSANPNLNPNPLSEGSLPLPLPPNADPHHYNNHNHNNHGHSSSSRLNERDRERSFYREKAKNEVELSLEGQGEILQSIVKQHPHIAQFYIMKKNLAVSLKPIPFDRRLRDWAPEEVYRSRRGESKTTLHWGQRKLLLSEIEFLTNFAFDGATILYAGAAPGSHTNYLSSLFPSLNFVLVDPNDFLCSEGPKIKIRRQLFTDEIAREYADKNVLFISDIRTADPFTHSAEEVEKLVVEDHQAQLRWYEIINPYKAMLKFRLPWSKGQTEYLDGDIYLQIWGPQSTTETRLIPFGREKRMWDNIKYEQQMFYFNTVTRVQVYKHNVHGEGIDGCYDCRAEVEVLRNYIAKYKPPKIEKSALADLDHNQSQPNHDQNKVTTDEKITKTQSKFNEKDDEENFDESAFVENENEPGQITQSNNNNNSNNNADQLESNINNNNNNETVKEKEMAISDTSSQSESQSNPNPHNNDNQSENMSQADLALAKAHDAMAVEELVPLPRDHEKYEVFINQAVAQMSYEMSRQIKPGRRTLLDPTMPKEEVRLMLQRKKENTPGKTKSHEPGHNHATHSHNYNRNYNQSRYR